MVENLPVDARHSGSIPGVGKKRKEEEMATHSSILAWKVSWAEEPGGLQSMGVTKSQTQLNSHTHTYTHTHTL